MGTLTRKMEPHQNCARSKPPAIGPMAMPSPIVPAQPPMARARSPGSRRRSLMMDREAGMVSAAPAPMTARASRSGRYGACENAAPSDADSENNQADQEEPLAPKPVSQAAAGEQQPGEDHGVGVDDPLQLARRGVQDRTRVGSATLRIVLSTLTMRAAAHTTMSVVQRRVCSGCRGRAKRTIVFSYSPARGTVRPMLHLRQTAAPGGRDARAAVQTATESSTHQYSIPNSIEYSAVYSWT